jgi:hypothetical protein
MPAENVWKEIARTLVDAFDVDIQIYYGKLLKQLRETPLGAKFAEWAEANPIAFETLLRLTSAAAQRLPKNDNLLIETVTDHLARLPVEIRRTIIGDHPSFVSMPGKTLSFDEGFYKKYALALEGLSVQDLEQVAKLSSIRLKEWVNSPEKIRPFLLKKWREEKSPLQSLDEALEPLADRLHKYTEERKKQRYMRKSLSDRTFYVILLLVFIIIPLIILIVSRLK